MDGWHNEPAKAMQDHIDEELTKELKALAFIALDGVIKRSPVLTGHYRHNHQVTIDHPSYTELDGTSVPVMPSEIDNLGPFSTVYIQNNCIYGEVVEFGHGSREPVPVYSLTFQDIQNYIDK